MSMSSIAEGGRVLWTHKAVETIRAAHGCGLDPEKLYVGSE